MRGRKKGEKVYFCRKKKKEPRKSGFSRASHEKSVPKKVRVFCCLRTTKSTPESYSINWNLQVFLPVDKIDRNLLIL